MFRRFLRSQIHPVTVTGTSRQHAGSVTVDAALLEAAGILPHETVLCSNMNNGQQFLLDARNGTRDRGEVILNGPASRNAVPGDTLIIYSYEHVTDETIRRQRIRVIHVDRKNRITRDLTGH